MTALGVDRLELLLSACGGAQGDFNLQTGEVRFSDRWFEMLGHQATPLAVEDMAAWDRLCHPDDLSKLGEAREQLARGETDRLHVEARMRHGHGQWRHIEVFGSVLSRNDADRVGWVTTIQFDRTDEREEEQRWRTRADMSADWYWQTDAQHRVSRYEAGPRWVDPISKARFLGLRRDQFQGIEAPPGGWEAFYAVLDRHEPFKGLGYTLLTQDGSAQMWVEIDGRPLFDADGRFLGYEGVGRDVTETQRTAAALRRSLDMVDALFESIPVPVVQKDLQGRYSRVNRAFGELFEVDAAAVLGGQANVLMDNASSLVHTRADEHLLSHGDGRLQYEACQTLHSGTVIDTLVTKSVIKDRLGRTTGLVASLVDITAMKRFERALAEAKAAAEAASDAKSAFLSTMSHEIRTPINGVLGMAELLGRTRLDAEQARMVEVILESGRGLLHVIDGVLDFSKIEAGKMQLEPEPARLEAIVESVCDALEPLAAQNNVCLRPWTSPQADECVMVDPTRMRQILLNLIGNAIKFGAGTDDAPLSVWVRVTREGTTTRLSVIDQGIGMGVDQQARLFSPFTQGDTSTTRRYGGTGLGLAICKRLVEAHGGRIELESAPGQGARFDVWLPLPAHALARPSTDAVLEGLNCIVHDGDTAHGDEDIARWLSDAGASVHPVASMPEMAAAATELQAPLIVVSARSETVLAQYSSTGLPVVWISHGHHAQPAPAGDKRLTIGRRRHWPLLRSVARAAGRQVAAGEFAPTLFSIPLQAGPRRRVLVAEDDPINQLVIQQQLDVLGYDVVVAGDGELAMRLWRDGGFDMLLTDLHMPSIDGFELAAAIRREERELGQPARIPILALTASVMAAEAQQARQAGIDHCLKKPVQMSVLYETIHALMGRTGPAFAEDLRQDEPPRANR